jgi:hypothetical protein
MKYLHSRSVFCNLKNQQAIRAEMGSDCCSVLGMTARGTTPVLALCRLLIETGHDPTTPLEVWRDSTLCLRIRRIGEAAQLTIEDDRHGRPRLRRWRNRPRRCGAAALVRQTGNIAGVVNGCER